MDQTPATRFVDVLGRLGYKTQQQIADLLDIARPTAGTIVRYEKPPSFESVAKLKEAHPEINMEWIFTGNGAAFVTGEAAPASATVAHAKPTTSASLSVAYPTPEEYRELQRENQELREQLARKEGALVAVEEDRTWLRKQIGGKTEASADAAAEDEYEPAHMEANWNHEYQPEREYAAVAASCNRDAYNWMDYATR